MTLADVCAGFGIQTVEITAEKWLACFISTDTHERSFILYGATDSDAACALLKARWGIHTWRQSSVGGEWFYAEHLRGAVMLIERERTELDAVAALARRLKETG